MENLDFRILQVIHFLNLLKEFEIVNMENFNWTKWK